MTLTEAAAETGRNPSTLRRAVMRGTLKAEKVGRDWLVYQQDLDAYLASADATERGKHMKHRKGATDDTDR